MTSILRSKAAFAAWLPHHPASDECAQSDVSVRNQIARYCDFLGTQAFLGADPLADAAARDRAVNAYQGYLELFNTAATPVSAILQSLDRFYVFLGLGPVQGAKR
jgi:hypothetical protein